MKKPFILLMVATLLSVLFYHANNSASTTVDNKLTRPPKDEIPILMYHKINPYFRSGGLGLRVPPKDFEQQLRYLREQGYNSITMSMLIDHYQQGTRLPKNPIVLTFDDGYTDNYTYALPLLKKYHYTATIFLVSGLVGKTNEWDEALGRPTNPLMNWDQIKEMEKAGIEFGGHTVTHPHLAQIPLEEARKEITKCKTDLEKNLGHPVKFFCYPYGNYNRSVAEAVNDAGFQAAVTVKQGRNTRNSKLLELNRIRVTGRHSLSDFATNLVKSYPTSNPGKSHTSL